MKKIIFLTLVTVCVMMIFVGCSSDEQSFNQKSYEADETQVKGIEIDVKDRAIEVSRSSDNQIHIDYSESEKEYYDISVSEDNVLSMSIVNNKKWSDYIGSKPAVENRKISLQIPDSLLESLKLTTTNEDIKFSELNVLKEISISVNGGNISFEKINAENSINLKSKNGNINGTIIGSYDDYEISCTIKKGESNLPPETESGSKKLVIDVNNGDVDIEFVK